MFCGKYNAADHTDFYIRSRTIFPAIISPAQLGTQATEPGTVAPGQRMGSSVE